MLLNGNEFALHPGVEATAFRENVVLDAQAGDPSAFVLGNGPYDVNGVTKAIVTVRNHRNAYRFNHALDGIESFTHSEDIGVRQSAHGRDPEAASPNRVKSCFFSKFGR